MIDLDEPVASYWPEFAQHDKGRVTVRHLLAHEAGLAVIDQALDLATIADPDALGSILATQAPKWPPGTRHGYHAQTLGRYESQLIRRVDPAELRKYRLTFTKGSSVLVEELAQRDAQRNGNERKCRNEHEACARNTAAAVVDVQLAPFAPLVFHHVWREVAR